MTRYFLFIASHDHLMHAIANGFIQQRYLNRFRDVHKGDYVVLYATKLNYNGKTPYRKFVGIGKVISDEIFEIPHGTNMYYRMMVKYKKYHEKDLSNIIDQLEFIKNKKNYGFYFIRGKRELSEADYNTIAK